MRGRQASHKAAGNHFRMPGSNTGKSRQMLNIRKSIISLVNGMDFSLQIVGRVRGMLPKVKEDLQTDKVLERVQMGFKVSRQT